MLLFYPLTLTRQQFYLSVLFDKTNINEANEDENKEKQFEKVCADNHHNN